MPHVVTYTRVSSDEQAHKDLSIPAQRKALARWIDERPEIDLAEAFVDEGESAYAPADKRPGGTVKLTKGGRDDPSMARCPSSVSRHTSPLSIRRTPESEASGGAPTAADVGRPERDSARVRVLRETAARARWI